MATTIGQPPILPSRTEPVDNSRTGKFIQSVVPFAQAEEREYGVPTSVSIAQAILETGWGRSTLNQIGLNYFGIKCTNVVSPYQDGCWNLSTSEYVNGKYVSVNAGFRTYATVANSFMDHGRFLTVNDRYAAAFNTTTSDEFTRAVAAAGYATSPTYANTLISIMQGYNLYNYDLKNADPVTINQPITVTGDIGRLYYSDPIYAKQLGNPVGDESDWLIAGSRIWVFDRGIIIWSLPYGSHAIYGDIWDVYRRAHAARTSLGMPVASTIKNGELITTVFESGHLSAQGGAILLAPEATAAAPEATVAPETTVAPEATAAAPDTEPATPVIQPPNDSPAVNAVADNPQFAALPNINDAVPRGSYLTALRITRLLERLSRS
ncbi:MAG: glucosaminidase domain-containing protein [Propionibacteriaceae bacterium]|nr:glucosaminidase domain-containing protein [Propionibacteriaceae bacterium]